MVVWCEQLWPVRWPGLAVGMTVGRDGRMETDRINSVYQLPSGRNGGALYRGMDMIWCCERRNGTDLAGIELDTRRSMQRGGSAQVAGCPA